MRISRRGFLKSYAGASASLALPLGTVFGAIGANDRIRVAVVGVRGRGRAHIAGFGKDVVALCDVDQQELDLKASEVQEEFGNRVAKYTDYRKLLENDDIDVVSIATPNHTHALIAIAAAQAGKDVYTEKPISHNVWEGRQMVHAARQHDCIMQCGTQARSSQGIADAVKFVRDGKLGKITCAIGTCYKPRESIGKLTRPLAIPAHINYDLWCGPAAKVDLYRPQLHYDWHWDFNTGSGDMGNQGIHQMDIARWFLGENALSPQVMSVGGRLGYEDAGNTPNTQIVYHDYEKAPLIFETRGLPRSKAGQKDWEHSMDQYRSSRVGVIVQCEEGHVLIPDYSGATAFDNDGNVIEEWDEKGNHFANFLKAVRSRNRAELNADILEGHLSTGLCHIGNISYRVGTKTSAKEIAEQLTSNPRAADSFERMASHLEANEVDIESNALTLGPWLEMDPESEQFTGNDEAAALLRRECREPFIVPDLSV